MSDHLALSLSLYFSQIHSFGRKRKSRLASLRRFCIFFTLLRLGVDKLFQTHKVVNHEGQSREIHRVTPLKNREGMVLENWDT